MRSIKFMAQRCNRNAKPCAFSFQLPQIISGLCAQPRLCTFAEYNLKAQCHFSRHARFAIDQFTQTFARHVQIFCRLCDAQTKRFKPQFLQHFTWMRRVKLFHCCALVVIQVIDDINIAILKSKAHTPICLNSYRPQLGFLSFQRMQTQRWGIDVINTLGITQHRQNQAQFFSMNRLNASLISCRIELFQAFVCETFNHGLDCNLTGFKITLTNPNHPAILCPPQNEVGFSSSFFRLGDNSPQFKAVFFCPQFFCFQKFLKANIIMTVLFGRPLRSVSPSRDSANSFNTVTRFLAGLCDGFTHFRLGITAWKLKIQHKLQA